MINFGFNEDAGGHLRDTDKVRELRPNRLRVSGDDLDAARGVINATGLRAIIVVGTWEPDPERCADLAEAALTLPNQPKVQVMNEPNNPVFSGHSAETVQRCLRAVIDRCGPDNVIGPAMTPAGTWRDYMVAAYRDTGCDHAALHLYPRADTFYQYIRTSLALGEQLANYVHVTEAGCERSRFPEQAKWTRNLYRAAARARTFIHHRLSEPIPANDWERQARLWVIRRDGQRTGLYEALKQVRSESG